MLDALLKRTPKYQARNTKLAKKVPDGVLKRYLTAPLPQPSDKLCDISLVAVDFETTGLEAKKDKLLSVGFVELKQNQIYLGTCYHQIVHSKKALKADNVTIHQITDDDKEAGLRYRAVVEDLLTALTGKIMLAHYNKIERTFLQQACLNLWGVMPEFPIIDTLMISKREFERRQKPFHPSQFQLSNLRNYYQLPPHHAHNALNDAVATAELFLAQLAAKADVSNIKLKALLS